MLFQIEFVVRNVFKGFTSKSCFGKKIMFCRYFETNYVRIFEKVAKSCENRFLIIINLSRNWDLHLHLLIISVIVSFINLFKLL